MSLWSLASAHIARVSDRRGATAGFGILTFWAKLPLAASALVNGETLRWIAQPGHSERLTNAMGLAPIAGSLLVLTALVLASCLSRKVRGQAK